jgi:hypothetical protein
MSAESANQGDLLEEARKRLEELEEIGNDELGERIELDPGEYFRGRWRADELVMRTKEGDEFPVYGLWDANGKPRFHYRNAALVAEIDAAKPAIGDEIVLVRGEDRSFETKGGELRTMHRYAVSTKPCDDPLPAEAASAAAPVDYGEEAPF